MKETSTNLLKKSPEAMEMKNTGSTGYGAFYSTSSIAQIQDERTQKFFDSYTEKVKTAYSNYPQGKGEKAHNKRWEDNVAAFMDLYKDIYKVDLRTTTNLTGIADNLGKLQKQCSENNKNDEVSSFAFTYVREDIKAAIPLIIRGIELRAARLETETMPDSTLAM